MRSVAKIRRLAKFRTAFIVPHADWFSEHRLSNDVQLPILGLVDTTNFQSRGHIIALFREAEIVVPEATLQTTDVGDLCAQIRQLLARKTDRARVLVRYGFSQSEASVAYFDPSEKFVAGSGSLKNELHCSADFLSMIETVGAVAELVPRIILAFPSVSLLLSGDRRIQIVGTFDRIHSAPFKFSGAVIPEYCLDYQELVGHARRLGGVLLNHGVVGYVTIDFLLYQDDEGLKMIGYDIRINSFPSLLMSAYMTLCAGFNQETGKMLLLKHVGEAVVNPARHVVIQNAVTHPGMGLVAMKDIKRTCFAEGMFFDLLNRTGFKMVFFDIPVKGKNFVLSAAVTPELALLNAERGWAFLLKLFGQKAGTDGASTLANGLQGIRRYRERLFVQGRVPVPLPT
jgi:hypothetical protein